jgi:hypothetical protein
MPRAFTRIEGACHCRNIRFVLLWPGSGSDILIRTCGCTFCRKRAGSWTSHRNAELVAEIADPAAVSKYRFGTKTADFYVCSVCGLVPFVLSDIGDRQYAVVNVNVFEDFDVSALPGSSTNFDGEDICSRLERRKRNWIPNVQVLEIVA